MDIHGRIMQEIKTIGKEVIHTQYWPAGVYLIQIKSDTEVGNYKLVLKR
jgi:hypothetical protein